MKIILGFLGLFVIFQGTILYQNKPLEQSIADGEEIYIDFCIQCHLDRGQGETGEIPPLAKSDYLIKDVDHSIWGVKYGLRGTIVVNGEKYNGVMENQGLDNTEIADVMNYILNNWGNESKEMVTEEQVASVNE